MAALMDRSSSRVLKGALAALLGAAPQALAAQKPDTVRTKPDSVRAAVDSLTARLQRTEEALELVRQQLAAQSESGAKSRSGLAIEFNGRILMNVFANTRRTNNADVPLTVRPDTANGLNDGGAGMEIRQTTLGLAVTSPSVLGAQFLGDIDLDFFGGQVATSGGRTMPLLRLRTARVVLTWPHSELLLGQEQPLVANLNPVSLAGVGTPNFSASGNLWFWIPQVRYTVEGGGSTRLGVSAALLAPMTGDAVGTFDTDYDIAERSRRPFVEGRVRLRWGSDDQRGEVGAGVHHGWLSPARGTLATTHGLMLDALVPLSRRVEVRGEAFTGRGLRVLGGGQAGQLLGKNNTVVGGSGGWAQLNIKPNARLLVGAGYGFDDPNDSELPSTGRLKNVTTELHAIAHPGGPLVLSAEWRRTTTTYVTRAWANDHLNVGVGVEF